ncbi:MAG: hypothetical protein ACRC6V_02050 [Bacteroidales bacterium]
MRLQIKDMGAEDLLWKELKSTHFNIHYNKAKQYEAVVKLLMQECGDDLEKEIRSVVTNTARMVKTNAVCLKIPRNKSLYIKNTQQISYYKMVNLLDRLESKGYVHLYIGGVSVYGFDKKAEEFDMSITETTGKFISLFDDVGLYNVSVGQQTPVEIKERKTKKILQTQGVKGVSVVKDKVNQFNTALIESRISLKGISLPDQSYKRVFIDNLTTGGRWYNSVGSIQTMDKTLRPFLQIDGEDLVELDFSAIHPNMLYEQLKAQLPKDFDPYGVDLWDKYVDFEAVEQLKIKHGKIKYDPSRNLVKMAVMIGLNCKDLKQAKKALSQNFGRDASKWGQPDEHKAKYFGMYEVDFEDVLVSVQEHNSLISDKFFKDLGVELQYLDSEILDNVICDTLAIDEVLLPWHDGLMVKKQIAEQVKGFMYKAWLKQFGSINFCKVDYK